MFFNRPSRMCLHREPSNSNVASSLWTCVCACWSWSSLCLFYQINRNLTCFTQSLGTRRTQRGAWQSVTDLSTALVCVRRTGGLCRWFISCATVSILRVTSSLSSWLFWRLNLLVSIIVRTKRKQLLGMCLSLQWKEEMITKISFSLCVRLGQLPLQKVCSFICFHI